ncbi:hypothetical protein [Aliarcobacter butzleri]|uniref:hypothetical protein n=1 Tax=Aliarcobacter butzleri TaxID=28197 RepID=UPI00263DA29E|nr:hypothetical protein [Aliarcobacter butzleri]MDN5059792.1 hypothetical protein [Aliarcobacter butzleri]
MENLEKAQREFLKRINLIFDNSLLDDNSEFGKVIKVTTMYHNKTFDFSTKEKAKQLEKENYIIDDLISMVNTERGFNDLITLCMIYKINFIQTLDFLTFMFIPTSQLLNKLLMEENQDLKKALEWTQGEDYYISIAEHIKNNLNEFVEKEDKKEDNHKKAFELISNSIKQEAMETTFKMVQEKLKNMKLGKYKDIDLSKFLKQEIKELDDFNSNKDYMNKIFSNPKITSRLYTKNNPHFMNKLSNDNLAYCKDTDSFYFKCLEESLSIAYTDKYLLINIDKKQAIKSLNEALKGLQILTNDEIEKQKNFIKEFINLIQNTNTNYYPFKVIGKTLGMNKNEARNYALKILNTVNPQVFNKQYEN